MIALVLRDLAVIGRQRAFVGAICMHAGLLAAFVVVWGNGMPRLPGSNVYEQQHLLQWLALGILLPWTAVRCLPRTRPSDVTALAVLTAVRPSQVLLARIVAGLVALSVVVLSGLPLVILAQQIGAVPLAQVLGGFVPMIAVAALASVAAVWWGLACRDRLAAWIGATATTAGVLLVGGLVASALVPWLIGLVGIAVAVATVRRADVTMRYVTEAMP